MTPDQAQKIVQAMNMLAFSIRLKDLHSARLTLALRLLWNELVEAGFALGHSEGPNAGPYLISPRYNDPKLMSLTEPLFLLLTEAGGTEFDHVLSERVAADFLVKLATKRLNQA